MPDLGKVTVFQPNLGKVTVFQPNRTTITSPNYRPKPNVALGELNDVATENVQDGYILVYRSANSRYEVSPATLTAASIDGGTF